LVATAKLNGVELLAWLTDMLERMVPAQTKAHELEQLLAWNWRAKRLASMSGAMTVRRHLSIKVPLAETGGFPH
jgi:hypothetical protein